MAGLTIEGVVKRYGDYRALDHVSVSVKDGEFLAVLGPSGCGKTTLLRQIAGFDRLDAGAISIGAHLVSSTTRHVPPEQRRIGIVFQSYALWPHMSVAENVAYGLTVAGVNGAEREKRVKAALDLVGLGEFGDRQPGLLSGGQRQRVALARCLVTEPSLVLLDEPLANLDVHLRAAMAAEFARFHKQSGTTMVYITHDQGEAMALADRIAVMDRGRLLQLAAPSVLYRQPASAMVAKFVGAGVVIPGQVLSASAGGCCRARVFGFDVTLRCDSRQGITERAQICLRARDLVIMPATAPGVSVVVDQLIYQGGYFRMVVRTTSHPGVLLHLDVAEPSAHRLGDTLTLGIADGWVIPEPVLTPVPSPSVQGR